MAVMDEPIEPRPQDSHKALGAYYTDSQIADFLVWWAVRDASDTVLDPAFGGGVFLRAACRRLRRSGAIRLRKFSGWKWMHRYTGASRKNSRRTVWPPPTCWRRTSSPPTLTG